MSSVFKTVGFFVLALVVIGVAQGVRGVVRGTDTPASIPYRVNEQFAEVGLSVPAQGGADGEGQPVPRQSVPEPVFGR